MYNGDSEAMSHRSEGKLNQLYRHEIVAPK